MPLSPTKIRLRKAKSRVKDIQRCAARFDTLCADVPAGQLFTFERRYIPCGKKNCVRCPHGAYWYAYWYEKGKMRNRYLGKYLPTRAKIMRDKRVKRVRIVAKEPEAEQSSVELNQEESNDTAL